MNLERPFTPSKRELPWYFSVPTQAIYSDWWEIAEALRNPKNVLQRDVEEARVSAISGSLTPDDAASLVESLLFTPVEAGFVDLYEEWRELADQHIVIAHAVTDLPTHLDMLWTQSMNELSVTDQLRRSIEYYDSYPSKQARKNLVATVLMGYGYIHPVLQEPRKKGKYRVPKEIGEELVCLVDELVDVLPSLDPGMTGVKAIDALLRRSLETVTDATRVDGRVFASLIKYIPYSYAEDDVKRAAIERVRGVLERSPTGLEYQDLLWLSFIEAYSDMGETVRAMDVWSTIPEKVMEEGRHEASLVFIDGIQSIARGVMREGTSQIFRADLEYFIDAHQRLEEYMQVTPSEDETIERRWNKGWYEAVCDLAEEKIPGFSSSEFMHVISCGDADCDLINLAWYCHDFPTEVDLHFALYQRLCILLSPVMFQTLEPKNQLIVLESFIIFRNFMSEHPEAAADLR